MNKIKSEGLVFGGTYKPRKNPFMQGDKKVQCALVIVAAMSFGMWLLFLKLGT